VKALKYYTMISFALAGMLEAGCSSRGYMERPPSSDGKVALKRIAVGVKTFYNSNLAYPVANVGPVPATPCCAQPGKICAPDPSLWTTKLWNDLDFAVNVPSHFQFTYAGTATEFTATAVGDQKCDGHVETITAHGTSLNGMPTSELHSSADE
jgi:hypothetical protein